MDTLLYYAKSADATWNGQDITVPKTDEEIKKDYPSKDALGPVRSDNLTGPSHGAVSGSPSTLPWRGYDVLSMGRVWSVPKTGTYAEY